MKRLDYPAADVPYMLYLPDDFDSQKTYPLIVFLHGRGERGADLALACKWGLPKYLDAGHDVDAIVYVPQCPLACENWVPILGRVVAGLDDLQATYTISKVHLTGFSMGGHGTHFLAVTHPDRFASVAPVATFMYPQHDVTDDVCVLKDTPIWIFHSAADRVPVEHSEKVVAKLKACAATRLTFTRYETADHTQSADLTYFDKALYAWMLG